MGYKSILRSVGTVVRQAERESIRRQKELVKRQIANSKMQELEQAAYDVEVYENYIDRLTSLHKDCISNYNWHEIIKKKAPVEPEKKVKREMESRLIVENYKPTFFDRIFKQEEKKRNKLLEILQKSIGDDKTEYEQLIDTYNVDLNEYNELMNLANGINKGDISVYKKAIEEFEPLSEISEIGSELGFKFSTKDRINIVMTTHDSKIVPKEAKSLLKSGKLTIKELSIGKYNEIYQDYVCSSALRVAREIFGLLPVEEIIVTSKSRILNKTTGKLEDQPILSVRFVRETMNNINFSDIDPSDSMTNFVHNMGFKKSQGMSPVDELNFA